MSWDIRSTLRELQGSSCGKDKRPIGTLTAAFTTGCALFEVAMSKKLHQTKCPKDMAIDMKCNFYLGAGASCNSWTAVPSECRDTIVMLCKAKANKRVWPAEAELICMAIIYAVCPFGFIRPFYSWCKTMTSEWYVVCHMALSCFTYTSTVSPKT
jgi:hypothetical protein